MKKIVCHPDNAKILEAQFQKEENKERKEQNDSLFIILPFLYDFRIQTNIHMDKERPTGRWLVEQNKFYSYWDGKGEPPSWAIYFGFVKKEMELNFYVIDESRAIWMDPMRSFLPRIYDKRVMTMGAV